MYLHPLLNCKQGLGDGVLLNHLSLFVEQVLDCTQATPSASNQAIQSGNVGASVSNIIGHMDAGKMDTFKLSL